MMDIKVNREIRDYTESIFFGLSLRQFVFSALSLISAVLIYFLLKPVLGTEITSWLCILVAVPPACFGFIKYNGMPAEKALLAVIKSEIVLPAHLAWGNTNKYFLMLEQAEKDIAISKKKLRLGGRKHVKNTNTNN